MRGRLKRVIVGEGFYIIILKCGLKREKGWSLVRTV